MSYVPENPGIYQGNQVIINSNRLVFNAKEDSILLFSKEAIGFSTQGSFHFDTSPDEGKSKFVVNSPNIYLGLEFDDTLPTQPAVLGDELGELLEGILELLDTISMDICTKITYVVTPPGGMTGINPGNFGIYSQHLSEINQLKLDIENIKSLNTKLV
tara:strand:+ start:219 stop:692 length:474 start_codon:yes stop_codon:yes gene_type:complete